MTKIVDIQFNSAQYELLPSANGAGDTNAIRTGYAEGASGYMMINAGGRVTGYSTLTLTGNSNRVVPSLELLEGNFVAPQNPTFDIWLSGNPTDIGSNYSQGAFRAIIQAPNPAGANTTFVAGYATSTARWHLSAYNGGGWGFQGAGYSAGNPSGGIYRVEVQWDTSQTNWVVARLYANDGTALFNSTLAYIGGTAYGINMLRFGDLNNIGGGQTWRFAEIEAWDTRDGDGTFSNIWSNASGGVFNTSYSGGRRTSTYSLPSNFSTISDSVSANFTSFTNQQYGNYSRYLDLFIPNGTPSDPSGYPVVIWAHSGFFVSGDKNTLVPHWRNRLLNAGYAVASIGYVKGTLTNGSYATYGTSNSDSGGAPAYGRYPSYIVDYKLASVRLRDKMSQSGTSPLTNDLGYGINGNKLIASGYSAGGYLALGAALSRDLSDDGSGRNMTIVGNSSYRVMENSSSYTGSDPEYKAVFVYGAPISLKTAMDKDWTHNLTNALLWPPIYPTGTPTTQAGAGIVHIAARAFMGTNVSSADPTGTFFTNTDITNIIAKQQVANPSYLNLPVGYVRGTADYLVDSSHQMALSSAVSGTAIKYSAFTTPAQHSRIDEIYSISDLTNFLSSSLYPWQPKVIII